MGLKHVCEAETVYYGTCVCVEEQRINIAIMRAMGDIYIYMMAVCVLEYISHCSAKWCKWYVHCVTVGQ